jgi:hypothetical protein
MTKMNQANAKAEATQAAEWERESVRRWQAYTGYCPDPAMTKMNQAAAESAYAERWQQAQELIAAIKARLDDMPAPSEETTWGQAADLGWLVDRLHEAAKQEETPCI